jgi:hypothetical protein
MKCVISHSRRIRARLATRLRFRASRLRPDLTSILSRHVRTRDDPVLKCPSTSQRELDLYCEEILRRGKSQLFALLLSALGRCGRNCTRPPVISTKSLSIDIFILAV